MTKTPEPSAPASPDKTPRKRTARKAPPSKEGLPEAVAPISRYEAFTMAPVDRASLKLTEYNPRIIDADAEARLEQEIKRGLVQPVIWNRRTGNVVGGHQRIARLDSLHQGKPYSLNVAVVDCDEAEEPVRLVVVPSRVDGLLRELAEFVALEGVEGAIHQRFSENASLTRVLNCCLAALHAALSAALRAALSAALFMDSSPVMRNSMQISGTVHR